MKIKDLIAFCNPVSVRGPQSGTARSLRLDSRKVESGDIFIAVKGTQTDGHLFVQQAIEQGAGAVIVDQDIEIPKSSTVIRVNDTRSLLSPLALKLAGNPEQKLRIIGITGTNGKTTVATLVWQVLRSQGRNAALLGTVSKKINDRELASRLTTADPVELASDLKQIVESNCEYVVMEVSSHALHQKRVDGIPFEIAAFTNLTLDHLDYHKNMDEYAAAKKILFDHLNESNWAVINNDDPKGSWMVSDSGAKVVRFSFNKKAGIQGNIIKASTQGTSIRMEGVEVHSPLAGIFNAYNVAQALLICTALGLDGKVVAESLAGCTGAPGRMEKVFLPATSGAQPVVIVDYTHTPDALKNVASTLADLKEEDQKLTIIFGCGGDRDTSKRPEMAKIAESFADSVVVTSDNPRSEDPDAIIRDIMKGFSQTSGIEITSVTARDKAIRKTVLESPANHIILIAGKGHETYQEMNGERIHFDDREIAREALAERNGHLSGEVN